MTRLPRYRNGTSIKQAMVAGGNACGLEVVLGSTWAAELFAKSGCDFVQIDMQHGAWGTDTAREAIRAIESAGCSPVARVAVNDFWRIGRLLDDGAVGIVVPTVNSAQEARAAVAACRYPPAGERSWGWGRAVLDDKEGYRARMEAELLVLVQIESISAVERAEEILGVDGVDGCWLGPADLALSMGIAPEQVATNLDHARAVDHVLAACRRTGKIPGFATGSPTEASARMEQGFVYLTIGNDALVLQEYAAGAWQAVGVNGNATSGIQ